jgi:Cu2+-exporting ATPase
LAAAGELARRGILIQRLDVLEALDRATHVVLDKTGTLTEDRLTLGRVEMLSSRGSGVQVRQIASSLAVFSAHPLSRAVAGEAARAPLSIRWQDVTETPGQGLQGLGPSLRSEPGAAVAEASLWWRLGHPVWAGVEWVDNLDRPAVWLACAEHREGPWLPVARFEFDEVVRPQARHVLDWMGSRSLVVEVLSGDQPGSVAALASRLGLERARGQCTPQDKLDRVGQIQADRGVVVMVGDGINDAPVLARADVSVAMGSGTALAQARADVIVLSNRIDAVRELIEMSRRTMKIVRQNLRWALAYNLVGVPLAAMGVLSPLLAGTGMALSSLLVVVNALRLTRKGQDEPELPYGDESGHQGFPLTGKP